VNRIPPAEVARLRALAGEAYPREACGVLVGRRKAEGPRVTAVVACRNLARAADRFELDPGDLVAAERAAGRRGEELLAVWHSHPDRPAVPSALDRAAAGWDQVIVAVEAGVPGRIAWYDGASRQPPGPRWSAEAPSGSAGVHSSDPAGR